MGRIDEQLGTEVMRMKPGGSALYLQPQEEAERIQCLICPPIKV